VLIPRRHGVCEKTAKYVQVKWRMREDGTLKGAMRTQIDRRRAAIRAQMAMEANGARRRRAERRLQSAPGGGPFMEAGKYLVEAMVVVAIEKADEHRLV
jgi:hypothetical protein